MRTTQQLSVTVPNRMATAIKVKVTTGEYASESEVIRDGLRASPARNRAVENWLQRVACPAYDALQIAPEDVRTIAQVRTRLSTKTANQNEA